MFDLQAWDKGFPWRRDLFFDNDSPACIREILEVDPTMNLETAVDATSHRCSSVFIGGSSAEFRFIRVIGAIRGWTHGFSFTLTFFFVFRLQPTTPPEWPR